MSNDDLRDQLLDMLLKELVGGETPPDVRERVLDIHDRLLDIFEQSRRSDSAPIHVADAMAEQWGTKKAPPKGRANVFAEENRSKLSATKED